MEHYKIALSPGDTVGSELLSQARKVLAALALRFGVNFDILEIASCGPAIDAYGTAFRDEDIRAALECQAILFGNIGDTGHTGHQPWETSVYALLSARQAFHVCTNIRPVYLLPELECLSPLKAELCRKGIDILIVRDLMGGMLNGEHYKAHLSSGWEASDLEYYNEEMVLHSALFAFRSARQRRGRVTSVDKANILSSSKLWRGKVGGIHALFSDVELVNDYVDHTAMELLIHPYDYDVLLTSNVFGDILADEAAQITGTPWLFGSAELAKDNRGVYTPNQLHHPRGSELAGTGEVSPYGILDTLQLLLRYSCGRQDMADTLAGAIKSALKDGLFTAEARPPWGMILSTDELGDEIAKRIGET